MARRPVLALLLCCGLLGAPAAAHAATGLHAHGDRTGAEPATGEEALRLARRLHDGRGVVTGRELTPVLRTLAEKLPELHGAERRRAERLLARPTQGQGTPGEETYSVAEAEPVCGPHFCVHYVPSTADAPPGGRDYAQTMLQEFENVYNVENVQMGWRAPVSDGDGKTDVYIKDIGSDGIYGYAAPDPGQQGQQLAGYLVMDNDYAEPTFASRYSSFIEPLRVTAAHEYNHVLQFAYDALQDSWMFEATATWMEDKVYDEVNDYRFYLGEWARRSLQPLTQFNPPSSNDSNAKVYGDAVFNRWIDERYGQETIRRAWEVSLETRDFAPAAYEKALNEKGTSFFDVFTRFAADTAEWRSANSAFEEGSTFPDMQRALGGRAIAPQNITGDRDDFVRGGLDHTGYALIDVAPSGQSSVTLGGTLPGGVAGAIAVVGRTGDDTSGTAVTQVKRLPNGGAGTVTLPNASSYTRVTAVVINSELSVSGFDRDTGDWNWLGDAQPITVAVNDFTKPAVRKTSPRPGAREVRRNAKVNLQFTETVAGVSPASVRLIGPGGRSVPLALNVTKGGKALVLAPMRGLARGRRYTVKLSRAVTDAGGNALPPSKRTWRFTTAR